MNLAFASRRSVYPYALGGAELSMCVLFKHLAQLGHSCIIYGELVDDPRMENGLWSNLVQEGRIAILNDRWPNKLTWSTSHGVKFTVTGTSGFERFITKELDCFAPDQVLTHLDGSLEVLLWAQIHKISSTFFVRDIANPYNWLPFITPWIKPDQVRVYSNSNFVQQYLKSHWNISSSVFYPPVDLPRRFPKKVCPSKPTIAFVNPAPSKGGMLVQELAARMPDFAFIVVEGWTSFDEITSSWPTNVTLKNWLLTLDDIFDQASAVIVPSQEPEAFCRIVPEAQARSTPVLVSAHTGLVEALGSGGILIKDYRNAAAWEHRLRILHNNPIEYQQCIERGLENVARFDADVLSRCFIRMLQEELQT